MRNCKKRADSQVYRRPGQEKRIHMVHNKIHTSSVAKTMCIVFPKEEELRDDPLQNTTRLLAYDQGRSGLARGRSRIESVLLAASFANFKGHYYVLRSAKATCKVLSNLVLPTREVLHISLGTVTEATESSTTYTTQGNSLTIRKTSFKERPVIHSLYS